jgi:hypothetical protein
MELTMEFLFMFLLFWLGAAAVVAVGANTRGRDSTGWFLLAILISPLLAGLFLIALPRGTRGQRKCPSCAEYIKTEATVCKHCGMAVPAPLPPQWSAWKTVRGLLIFAAVIIVLAMIFNLKSPTDAPTNSPIDSSSFERRQATEIERRNREEALKKQHQEDDKKSVAPPLDPNAR